MLNTFTNSVGGEAILYCDASRINEFFPTRDLKGRINVGDLFFPRQHGSRYWDITPHGIGTSSSPVPLKIHRVGKRCTLNLSRAQTSSRWCSSWERGVPAQVSSTSPDHGLKLRGPSPKALV
ncbi:hypothetical protein TNCV_4621341 [Trichonephila clavipes]|nr:hypothetical protein TNCV_4621341 [Trichonephila clavipes]